MTAKPDRGQIVNFGVETEPPGVLVLAIQADGLSIVLTARRRQFAALAATLAAVANGDDTEGSAELSFRRAKIEVNK